MTISRELTAKHLGSRPAGTKPIMIILHDTAGSGTKNDAVYLANDPEQRGISVDYVALRDGSIFQLNPDIAKHYTNHAGRSTQVSIGRAIYSGPSVNRYSIGIEMAHAVNPAKQSPEWPDEQVNAVAQLCAFLCETYKIEKANITTHAKIITDGSRSDPRNFPFDKFWTSFASFSGTPVDEPAKTYTVKGGDTITKIASGLGVSIESIKQLNDFDGAEMNHITVGQILRVRA